MSRRRRIALLTALVTGVLWFGMGPTARGQQPEAEADQPVAAEPDAPAQEAPSADEVMQQLMQRRRQGPPLIEPTREAPVAPAGQADPRPAPTIPVTPPTLDTAVVGPGPEAPRPPLLREGQYIVDRRARLQALSDGTHVALFIPEEGQPALPPMVLLRSRRLEAIEQVLARQGQDTIFRLSGPVYVYHGVNHVLPAQAAPAGRLSQTQPATDEQGGDPAGTAGDPLTAQLLEELRARTPAMPGGDAVAPATTTRLDPRLVGTAPPSGETKLRMEGEVLLNRLGRLIRTPEGYQLFVFEADDLASPEPPVLLLPSRLLEDMEALVADRGDALVFSVSGQIFVYHGGSYLLPTTMRVAFNKGNLGIDS